jgi:hypothetical protein
MALLFAVVLSLLLAVLGLGLTYFSIAEFTVGNEFESHQRAFAVADGGYSLMKDSLRGRDLTTVLSTYTTVPEYVDLTAAAAGTAPYRNPIYPIDARNIDFRNPPTPVGSINVNGLLTPTGGIPLGSGYFFARISDNSDGDNDFEIDQDYTIFLRVVGVHPGPLAEISSYGGSAKNSVSIVEALMKRDFTFDMGAPLSIAGPDVTPIFEGASFSIAGDEEHPGVSVFYDDPNGGDAGRTSQSLNDVLLKNQVSNVTGAEGDFGSTGPSIRDDTQVIRDSGNPDSYNVLNPSWLASFVMKVAAAADQEFPGGTVLDGGTIELGTEANPQITYCDGDLRIAGGGTGYGILVVTGALQYEGAFDFEGLILVLGAGELDMGGVNKSIVGGMFIANLAETDGSYDFGVANVAIRGRSNFLFDSTSIRMAINLLPLKTLMWREITPDIEPVVQEADQPSIGEPDNGIIISTY